MGLGVGVGVGVGVGLGFRVSSERASKPRHSSTQGARAEKANLARAGGQWSVVSGQGQGWGQD